MCDLPGASRVLKRVSAARVQTDAQTDRMKADEWELNRLQPALPATFLPTI